MSSTTSEEITLYDLPSSPPNACWSLNPWKTRLVLNYKAIPYKTTWLEYPSIAPTFTALGIPPNDPALNPTPYSIPAVRLPDGRYIMDSLAIATEIEKLHPEKPLRLDAQVLGEVMAVVPEVMGPMRGVVMPGSAAKLLNPESKAYFEETREKRFGMPLEELARKEGGDEAYEKARPAFRKLGELLEKNGKGGPFFLGEEASFVDFVVVGLLEFMRRIEEGILERVVGMEPGLGRLYEACKPWLERNDR